MSDGKWITYGGDGRFWSGKQDGDFIEGRYTGRRVEKRRGTNNGEKITMHIIATDDGELFSVAAMHAVELLDKAAPRVQQRVKLSYIGQKQSEKIAHRTMGLYALALWVEGEDEPTS